MNIEGSYLNEGTRARNLAAIGNFRQDAPLDLLIAGGGVTGLGAALDAAARGLNVGLVEKGDYASGASGASSRLAHGGLRYLEQGHIRLVREALSERRLLVTTIAPHLTHRADFLFPARSSVQLPYLRAGVGAYDLLARMGGGLLPGSPSRMVRKRELQRIAPGLDTVQFSGAIQFADAQIDDARHTMVLARTAQAFGASVANYATLTSVRRRERGVIHCTIDADGEHIETWAKTVLFACGPWTNHWSDRLSHRDHVRPSKGVHVVVPKSAIDLERAVLSRTKDSVLFVLPWNDTWIIGTTDDDYQGPLDQVNVEQSDIAYLVDQANRILSTPISETDITATYAGLRPLPAQSRSTRTTRVSREHVIEEVNSGMFCVFGGKYTTYRIMAKDAIDAACADLGRQDLSCTTDRIPLVGAGEAPPPEQGADTPNLPPPASAESVHLVARYGTEANAIMAAASNQTNAFTAIVDGSRFLRIDVEQAFAREGARTVEDVLARRLRLTTESTVAAERATPIIEAIARQLRTGRGVADGS